MKKSLFFLLLFVSLTSLGQIFQSYNINLISLITPNQVDQGTDGRRYSGCWGWYQSSKNKEYAISGTSNGTYFIDVSSPTTPTVSGFIAGAAGGTYREMKTYQNYCYIVSDDGQNKKFQIVDMQYLPDSIHVVYNDTTLFKRGHTIWIDKDKMYIGAMLSDSLKFSPMAIYSLATPTAAVLLRKLQQDLPLIGYVHDMYVRNDTIYASCGDQGLYIIRYNSTTNTFVQLGSYIGYQSHGYNHSSFLTQDGKHLIFCDEVPESLPIHFVDVQNLGNIQPVKDFIPFQKTTPHNPYIKGNFAVVSCYQDGLHIYDLSQPNNINIVGYFDTHPQGGANVGNYGGAPYRGNWGAYPFLPSGIIIANDMQNGMFILNANSAYTTTIKNPVGINATPASEINFIAYPNPATNYVSVHYNTQNNSTLRLKNILGALILETNYSGPVNEYIDVRSLQNGSYFISITENNRTKNNKIIINH
jgi:choice-of-anchor B domain-containing protein